MNNIPDYGPGEIEQKRPVDRNNIDFSEFSIIIPEDKILSEGNPAKRTVKSRLKNKKNEVVTVFEEEIMRGFLVQLVYLHSDYKNHCFNKESPDYERARKNFRLLYRRNLIVVLVACGPLMICPLPGSLEFGLYGYHYLLARLPERVKDALRLKFQIREDMPAEVIHNNMKNRFKDNMGKLRSRANYLTY